MFRFNIIITPVVMQCCYILFKIGEIKIVVKIGKTWCICVVECSLYGPCNKNIVVMSIIL